MENRQIFLVEGVNCESRMVKLHELDVAARRVVSYDQISTFATS